MNCPKCEDGVLSKIAFQANKKYAYLCDHCGSYWYEDEHISITTGHMLEEYAEGQNPEDAYVYIREHDEEVRPLDEENDRKEVTYEKQY